MSSKINVSEISMNHQWWMVSRRIISLQENSESPWSTAIKKQLQAGEKLHNVDETRGTVNSQDAHAGAERGRLWGGIWTGSCTSCSPSVTLDTLLLSSCTWSGMIQGDRLFALLHKGFWMATKRRKRCGSSSLKTATGRKQQQQDVFNDRNCVHLCCAGAYSSIQSVYMWVHFELTYCAQLLQCLGLSISMYAVPRSVTCLRQLLQRGFISLEQVREILDVNV